MPVVGLARVVCPFFALLTMLLRSLAPAAHLLSLVLALVALCILRYPTEFLEVLGLFVTQPRKLAGL